jgi:SNF2 family DNA or RNA helicase
LVAIDIRKADKVSGEWGMFLSFPYDEQLLGLIRGLPSRYWHGEKKEWEVPLNKLKELVDNMSNYEIQLTGALSALEEKKVPDIDFKFKTKPFDHQIEGFNYGLTHNKWLLGDSMGLGKTLQVITIAVAKKQLLGYRHCLIICGINGLKWNWLKEINKHSDESGYILGQRTNTRNKLVIGSNTDKLNDVEKLFDDNSEVSQNYFIITNVESLRDEKITNALKKLCDDGTIGMIALDECHVCKNPQSQQGKGILKLNADNMIAMTGTPLLNTPLDLYIILKWLGYEKHSFYAFKNHYCIMGGYGGYQIVGYQHTDELREILSEIMLRRLKEDVLDLPEKLYVDEYVEMSKEQEKIYNEILDDIRLNVDKIASTPNPLSQLIRLRQATGYTGILSSDITVSAKLDRMEEIVEDAVAEGKKVVIFSNWTQITDEAYKRLSKKFRGIVITGETKDADRQALVNSFQTDSNVKFALGTTGAMGTGIDLYAGTIEVFLDIPWTRGVYDQAVDRCHRIGQKNSVTIYNIICKNTIDERIAEIVQKKGALSDELIDGKTAEDKRQLLNYLLS